MVLMNVIGLYGRRISDECDLEKFVLMAVCVGGLDEKTDPATNDMESGMDGHHLSSAGSDGYQWDHTWLAESKDMTAVG